MGKKVTLWDVEYDSIVRAKRAFNAWWKTLDEGFYFVTNEEYPRFQWLAEHHPESRTKLKEPVFSYKITKDYFGHKTTRIVYESGNEVDISLPSCLVVRTTKQNRRQAMRLAINDQILDYLYSHNRCEKCGSVEKLEVHHKGTTFEKMAQFYETTICYVPTKFKDDPNTNFAMFLDNEIDQSWALGWVKMHLNTAKLQTLCHPCHTKVGRKC